MKRIFCAAVGTATLALCATSAVAVEADEEGNVIEAADGRSGIQEGKPYRMVPLGPEGHLVLNKELRNKAVYKAKKPFKPGLRLFGAGGKDAVIVSQHGPETQRVMNELRWHLEKMIGRDVRVVPKIPTDGTPALTVKFTSGPFERSVVRQEGNVLFIEGSDEVGMSHALTYVLEALGFRYLWPGTLGKVIPKTQDVYLPEGIALDYVPELKVVRRIRSYYSIHEARVNFGDKLGLDVLKVAKRKRLAGKDDPENRGFFAWHGLNDSQQVIGPEPSAGGAYRWEHRFNDYYERFGKEHPDWFALQVNGQRDQDSRPCFCMSNEGLIEQMANETIEMIDREPGVISHSLCLPDGGYRSFCLCANCRRMDPKNSPVREGRFYYPVRMPMTGYSMTDRVLAFKNAIAERVTKARPGKKLSIYVYSSYVEPPKAVTPHPDFLIISVAGGNYCTTTQRAKVLESLAAWGTFGNPFVWRPNALAGFRPMMPSNAGRWLFEDVETLKANGLVGTDFDCYNGAWATDGLTFYMLSKAHLNPDRLGYDDLVDDYCATGFGAAAPAMRRYYDKLSAYYAEAAARQDADPKGNAKDNYVRHFDIPGCERILDEADALAADDAEVRARIRFVRRGLELAKWEKRNSEAAWAKADKAELAKIRRGYAEFVLKTYDEEPLAISPGSACFRGADLGPDPLGILKKVKSEK